MCFDKADTLTDNDWYVISRQYLILKGLPSLLLIKKAMDTGTIFLLRYPPPPPSKFRGNSKRTSKKKCFLLVDRVQIKHQEI